MGLALTTSVAGKQVQSELVDLTEDEAVKLRECVSGMKVWVQVYLPVDKAVAEVWNEDTLASRNSGFAGLCHMCA